MILIISFLQSSDMPILLLKKGREEEDSDKLKQILQAGNRAKLLVQQILTFARKTEEKSEQVQFATVVHEVIKLLQASLPSSIEIVSRVRSEGCVQGDTTKIHQLVLNLCTNAGKAMPDGGTLHIDLCEKEVTEEMAGRHPNVVAGNYLCLTVRDSGRGIPMEHLGKIFDPFFTTEVKQKGTGLGLSVVHGIVQESRGIIEVKSKKDAGSTFTVYLPEVKCTDVIQTNDEKVLPQGTESIMVIDDEENLINVVSETLSQLGYVVEGFLDGSDAVEAFMKAPQLYDLVITDMTMPRMGGDEVARKLLQLRSNLPVIICSGYSETFQESDAMKIGVKRYLVKPVSMSNLAAAVRQVLDGQDWVKEKKDTGR